MSIALGRLRKRNAAQSSTSGTNMSVITEPLELPSFTAPASNIIPQVLPAAIRSQQPIAPAPAPTQSSGAFGLLPIEPTARTANITPQVLPVAVRSQQSIASRTAQSSDVAFGFLPIEPNAPLQEIARIAVPAGAPQAGTEGPMVPTAITNPIVLDRPCASALLSQVPSKIQERTGFRDTWRGKIVSSLYLVTLGVGAILTMEGVREVIFCVAPPTPTPFVPETAVSAIRHVQGRTTHVVNAATSYSYLALGMGAALQLVPPASRWLAGFFTAEDANAPNAKKIQVAVEGNVRETDSLRITINNEVWTWPQLRQVLERTAVRSAFAPLQRSSFYRVARLTTGYIVRAAVLASTAAMITMWVSRVHHVEPIASCDIGGNLKKCLSSIQKRERLVSGDLFYNTVSSGLLTVALAVHAWLSDAGGVDESQFSADVFEESSVKIAEDLSIPYKIYADASVAIANGPRMSRDQVAGLLQQLVNAAAKIDTVIVVPNVTIANCTSDE